MNSQEIWNPTILKQLEVVQKSFAYAGTKDADLRRVVKAAEAIVEGVRLFEVTQKWYEDLILQPHRAFMYREIREF